MQAVGLYRYLPIDDPESLVDVEVERPVPEGRDLLVAVRAIAVNPVDYKSRARTEPREHPPRILGWDAAGEVVEAGPDACLFKPGDRVFYAGDVTRQGSNAEFALVDERLVGPMPASLDYARAAALPLTSITAWESLFHRLRVPAPPVSQPRRSLLIVGGAGGVGSIAIQLAAKVAGLTVVATASRPETEAWCRELGAHHVINHFGDMPAQLKAAGFDAVDYVLLLNNTDQHFPAAAAAVAPQGHVCAIVDNTEPLPMELLKPKSASFHWEFMFTRSMFGTDDMIEQHYLLTEIARLVDAGVIRTTAKEVLQPINAANLRHAHALLEAGHAVGKVVLEGFPD